MEKYKRVGLSLEGEVRHETPDGGLISAQRMLKKEGKNWFNFILLRWYDKMRVAYAEKYRDQDISIRYRMGGLKHNVVLEIVILLLRRLIARLERRK
jgi:hypothetical protein